MTSNNENTPNALVLREEGLSAPGEVQPEDLKLVSQWTRDDLFDKVRFLYNPDHDLRVDGPLHKLFVRNCKHRLLGLKATDGASDRERQLYEKLYVKMLWADANKKRRNLVAIGLTVRRSSVYSAMQNRFVDLCNLCKKKNAVMPSLEAFEARLDIPGVYFIFYDYFFRSSAGDARWKKAWLEENKDLKRRLASEQTEAFAMLVLKNNYFAWLLAAKEKLGDALLTDYDTDLKKKDKMSSVEAYLGEVEIDLEATADEGEDVSFVVSKHEDADRYAKLKQGTDKELKKIGRKCKDNEYYKNLKKQLEKPEVEPTHPPQGLSRDDQEAREREEMRKRRKLMKTFRVYTTKEDKEDGFKGWSERAASDMADMVKKLKEEGDDCRKFSAAYREVCRSRNKRKRAPTSNQLIEVDYNELWELDDENIVPV